MASHGNLSIHTLHCDVTGRHTCPPNKKNAKKG